VQIFFAMAQILARKTINQVFIKDFQFLVRFLFNASLICPFHDCFFNEGFFLTPPSGLENSFFQLSGGGVALVPNNCIFKRID